ncbi:MAG: dihydroorotate dehydrogenase electron transfer subunit [Candidatus Altiarchaeales archaeon IMC4]|nr:MAG: dihydroorotate dehydrogenase electron transfer subunit [Candidatus Altiarchaeales archaeon IMC4]
MNSPEMVKILEIYEDSQDTKTLVLDKRTDAKPGQFAMLWIPGAGEKPFSFSWVKGNIEVTVRMVGGFTKELFKLKKGDFIGFRGPYGNGVFRLIGKKVCVVSGGVGVAPLIPLVEQAREKNVDVTILAGSTTQKCCLLRKNSRLRKKLEKMAGREKILTTTDGCETEDRFVTELLEEIMKNGERFDYIYTCGPEIMMKKVADIAEKYNTHCEVSLDRYIKCGVGICGQCAIDPSGLMICKDGPVFNSRLLKDSEFGRYKRDSTGTKIEI